jgi:SAM-dependent methyltransferase
MAHSRLYETALLGPLAEQLVDAASVTAGARVVDVGARGGVLTRRLAAAVGWEGAVVAVETSDARAQALRDELEAARVVAPVVVAPLDALPFGEQELDVALSLFGVPATRGGDAALREMERVAHGAVVVTPGEHAPAPEALLETAWQDAAGFVPPLVRGAASLHAPGGWSSTLIRDVVRCDSARQLWEALTAGPRGRAPEYVVDAVWQRYRDLLSPYAAADGTLRIPIEVALLRHGLDI